MKKTIVKTIIIAIIAIIALLFTSTKTFATNSFKVAFKDGYKVKSGEILEIPIILDSIEFEGAEKGLSNFSCKIEYDEDVFELVKVNEETETGEDIYIRRSSTLRDTDVEFYKETNVLLFNVKDSSNTDGLINKSTEVGTMKFKVKENVESGYYNLKISELTGGNKSTTVRDLSYLTDVYVDGIEDEEESLDNLSTILSESLSSANEEEKKELIINFIQNEEGTQVEIIPDEEKGTKITKIVVDGKELERKDNKYILETVPDDTYIAYIYGADLEYPAVRYIKAYSKDNSEGEEPTDNQTDEPKDDAEKTPTENKENNVDKSAQTGDLIWVAVAVLIIASAVLGTLLIVNNKFEE